MKTLHIVALGVLLALAGYAGWNSKGCTTKERIVEIPVAIQSQTVYVDTGSIKTVTRYREVVQYMDSTYRLDSLRARAAYLQSQWFDAVEQLAEFETQVEVLDTAISRTARFTLDGGEIAQEWTDSVHVERQTFPRSYSLGFKDAVIPLKMSTAVPSSGESFWSRWHHGLHLGIGVGAFPYPSTWQFRPCISLTYGVGYAF